MAPFVLKIKYGDDLRRLTLESVLFSNRPDMSFAKLVETIRESFKIPATSDVVVVYTDRDNDVVTMAGDDDLLDALVFQGLNPLRLTVTVVAHEPAQRPAHHGRHGARWVQVHGHDHGHAHGHGHDQGHAHGHGLNHGDANPRPDPSDFRKIFGNTLKLTQKMSQDTAKQTVDYAQQLMQACEPLVKGAPSIVASELKDAVMKLVNSSQAGASSQPSVHREDQAPSGLAPPFPALVNPWGFAQQSGVDRFAFPPPGFNWTGPESSSPSGAPYVEKVDQATPAPSQDNKDPVQHRGVQCDMCNMVPIVGIRYKSNKKHDYDLCQNCFQKSGSIEDFTKIERPLWRPRHFNSQFSGGRMRCPAMSSYYGGRPSFTMRGPHMHGPHMHAPHGFHGPYSGRTDMRGPNGCAFGSAGGKLDARFVQDVTIFDGTEFAPGSAFTKIWRLRNSGTTSWPKSTQLIHVGGDELGSVLAVTLELPEEGLNPECEAEVSVDLVAPQKPGRYVSHWRLVSPSGQKFGHRVWVLIQVVPCDEQSPQMMESLLASSQQDIEMPEQEAPEVARKAVTIAPEAMEDDTVVEQVADPFPTVEDSLIVEPPVAGPFPIAEEAIIPEQSVAVEVAEVVTEMPAYPSINMEALSLDADFADAGKTQEENNAVENSELGNFSMVNMPTVTEIPVFPSEQAEDTAAPQSSLVIVDAEPAESEEMRQAAAADSVAVLLGALESMGFKQRALNQELLEKNEYDVQRTVDDLVMAVEWDPMLEELEEMGFYDTDMNRRLMFKNNGSVKRTVKELVQMYKEPKGKEQI